MPAISSSPRSTSVGDDRRTEPGVQRSDRIASIVLWLGVAVLSLALRVPALDGRPDDRDSVGFIAGVEDFDIARQQPHFPGYPLFIALAKSLRVLGTDSGWSLEIVDLACGVVLPFLVARIVAMRRGRRAGAWVGLLVSVHPLLVSESWSMRSDIAGLAVLCGSLVLLGAGRFWLAGLAAGLLLGLRISYAPFAVGLLFGVGGGARCARLVAGGVCGTASWLVPLVLVDGGIEFGETLRFLHGHFLIWGNTPFGGGASITDWPTAIVSGTLGLEVPVVLSWILVIGVAIGVLGRRGRITVAEVPALDVDVGKRAVIGRVVAAGGIVYSIWLLFAQNPDATRHVMPITTVVIGAISEVSDRWRPILRITAIGALALSWGVLSFHAIAEARNEPPAVALGRYVDRGFGPGTTVLLAAGSAARVLEWSRSESSTWSVVEVRTWADLIDEIDSALVVPEWVGVTSEVTGQPADARPTATFERRRGGGNRVERLDLFAYRVEPRSDAPTSASLGPQGSALSKHRLRSCRAPVEEAVRR
jgi:hypothetical protein